MQSHAAEPPPTTLTHREILLVFSSLMLGMLLAALDQTILATALPTIVGELGGLEYLSWVITAYLLTTTASVPLYGKIGDIYGRKRPFLFAICVFLLGSILAGFAQDMTQLIICRGIQGVGAGGLMVLAQAIIGDLISPRERGKYVGYFVIVFAGSSIGGPLLGGVLVENLSWRWVFFINVPLGALALIVTSRVLKLPYRHVEQRIDFVGAGLIMAAASCILLGTSWGGNEYAWGSLTIIGLIAGGIALTGVFVLNELRVTDPIVPLRLFRNRIFSVTSVLGLISGMAMFGTIAFLPLYMQIVKGVSPTASGLRMLPLILCVLSMSILSGRLISKTGRYRHFPIMGTGIMAFALFLLSRLGSDSSWLQVSLTIACVGLGMGLIMQTITLAAQNAVEYQYMGTATAAVNFFRSMGGALGVAAFGAILSNRVNVYLARFVPAGADTGFEDGELRVSPERIRQLPEAVHTGVIEAFAQAISDVFIWAVPLAVFAFLVSWWLKEIPLRERPGQSVRPGTQAAVAEEAIPAGS
ncbi:MAG TPA: MDR family MFS transporter [Dehalococcoidia bacterium]|nr:MDR family MFS transporter [Dehalococcoidia bacterium]